MGTVISHSPISLYDLDKKKLEMKLDPQEMYKKFVEKYIKNFKLPISTDEFRPNYANTYYGGVDFPDAKTTSMLRGIGWDLIKQIGKKIISGDFNLTTVTIPIRVMVPISILQHICNGHFNFPLYLHLASKCENPLDKMKYVITATLSSWFKSNIFLKPLNPILGETYEMMWEDGSHCYIEQTSHHPPISYFILRGPNKEFTYSGYYNYTTNAWFNSAIVKNMGKRVIEFKDSRIEMNSIQDQFSNIFWGTIRHECIGDLTFVDTVNHISATFSLGNVSGKFSDYFEGDIINDETKEMLSHFYGSYLSYIEFDGVRYWDIRENIDIEPYPIKNQIKSSSIYRPDSILLNQRKLEEAQEAKDQQENVQRRDRKLRKEYLEKQQCEEEDDNQE